MRMVRDNMASGGADGAPSDEANGAPVAGDRAATETRAVSAPAQQAETGEGAGGSGRRRWLRTTIGAALGAAALVASKPASPAEAAFDGTVNGASTASIGILASTGAAGAPILPILGVGTTHSIIGSQSSLTVLPIDSAVAGARSGSGRAGVLGANGGSGFGVYGVADAGTGVAGVSTSGIGVTGTSTSSTGVQGTSTSGIGVGGTSSSGAGVTGISGSNAGIFGIAQSAGGTGLVGRGPSIGLWGFSDSPANDPREGARGQSTHGPGVYGLSTNSTGVLGETSLSGQFGVLGRVSTAGAAAVGGIATSPATLAGAFTGNVAIAGNLIVTGTIGSSGSSSTAAASVQHPDGTNRRVFSPVSTESTLEDCGSGQMANGGADVVFDPELAALIGTKWYAVFLQPEGDCRGLYVSKKTPAGFSVRELGGGTSSIAFSYRIVVRRANQGDGARRLERVEDDQRVERTRNGGLRVNGVELRAPHLPDAEPPAIPVLAPPTTNEPARPERRIRSSGNPNSDD